MKIHLPIEWLADACRANTILIRIMAAVSSLLVLYGRSVGCPTNLTSFTFNSNFLLHNSALTAKRVDNISSVKPLNWPKNKINKFYLVHWYLYLVGQISLAIQKGNAAGVMWVFGLGMFRGVKFSFTLFFDYFYFGDLYYFFCKTKFDIG